MKMKTSSSVGSCTKVQKAYEPVWLDKLDLNKEIWNDGNGSHQVMEMPIYPHRIKDDETYLQVAAVYG